MINEKNKNESTSNLALERAKLFVQLLGVREDAGMTRIYSAFTRQKNSSNSNNESFFNTLKQ